MNVRENKGNPSISLSSSHGSHALYEKRGSLRAQEYRQITRKAEIKLGLRSLSRRNMAEINHCTGGIVHTNRMSGRLCVKMSIFNINKLYRGFQNTY